MKLSRPSTATWLIAVIIGGAGILLNFGVLRITGLGIAPFWFVTVAFVLLAASALMKSL